MSEKVLNTEKTAAKQDAGTNATGMLDTKAKTLKSNRRDIVNAFIGNISEEQKQQMRVEVAKELREIKELKERIRNIRKEDWRAYTLSGIFGALTSAGVYAIISQFHSLNGKVINLPDVIFTIGVMGIIFFPIFIYLGLDTIYTDIYSEKGEIKAAKERLRRLSFGEQKRE